MLELAFYRFIVIYRSVYRVRVVRKIIADSISRNVFLSFFLLRITWIKIAGIVNNSTRA